MQKPRVSFEMEDIEKTVLAAATMLQERIRLTNQQRTCGMD